MKEILKVNNIKKIYQSKNGEINAIGGISFTANEGEFISIIGPSRMWKIKFTFNYCRLRRKNKWRDLFKSEICILVFLLK